MPGGRQVRDEMEMTLRRSRMISESIVTSCRTAAEINEILKETREYADVRIVFRPVDRTGALIAHGDLQLDSNAADDLSNLPTGGVPSPWTHGMGCPGIGYRGYCRQMSIGARTDGAATWMVRNNTGATTSAV